MCGLVCRTCNTGLGFLKDNPAIAKGASDYSATWPLTDDGLGEEGRTGGDTSPR